MLGIWVEEFDPLEPDMRNRVLVPAASWLPSGSYDCDLWCDLVHLEGAQALATDEEDFDAGRPAITEHRYGQGRALYVATRPAQPLIAAVIERLLDDLGVAAPLEAPAGVEVTRREGDGQSYLFVLNHNPIPVHVTLPSPMQNLVTGETCESTVVLPPLEVAILTQA
jgi:beta-galactosidase